jgi:hypothetical protein
MLIPLAVILIPPWRDPAKRDAFPGFTVRLRSPSLSRVEGRVNFAKHLALNRVNNLRDFSPSRSAGLLRMTASVGFSAAS